MPLIAERLPDYTDKDFVSIRARLRNLATSVFPEWTDFNAANFGNLQLELIAHVADILLFYQDGQGRQSRLVSTTQRRAALAHVKAQNYRPATASAATADIIISIPKVTAGDVPFPKGTIVKTQEVTSPTQYQLLEDHLLPAGSLSIEATVENSESRSEQFSLNGKPNQQIRLASSPFIDGTEIISTGTGIWTRVDNFLASTAADLHYLLEVDQNDRALIKFGNGVNGASPSGLCSADYRIGGGSAGRVEMNKLVAFDATTWTDTLGNSIIPSVTNPAASVGGDDRQTVAQIRERAPAALTTLKRSVSSPDFEINVMRDGLPIARALFLTSNEDTSVDENSGELYIIPTAGDYPTEELKARALNQVTVVYPCTTTFRVDVKDPVYKVVNVQSIVYFDKAYPTPASRSRLAAIVYSRMRSFFAVLNPDGTANAQINFGGRIVNAAGQIVSELALSDVLNVVRDTPGIRKLLPEDFLLNSQNRDVVLSMKEFPKLGTILLVDGDTGAEYHG